MKNVDIYYGKDTNKVSFNCIDCSWYNVQEVKNLEKNIYLECKECKKKEITYLGNN